MNQGDLIKDISQNLFLTYTETKEAFDLALDKVIKDLKKGKRIYIRGFGSLHKIKRKKKKGYNFKKKRTITIPAHFSVEFRPAPALKKKINK